MAGSAIIGALRVVLGMDSAAFEKGTTEAERRMARFQKTLDRTSKRLTKSGRAMSIGVTAPLVAFATKSVGAMRQQEEAVNAVAAVLSTMGDTAGFTLDELTKKASKLQSESLFGDEEILQKVTSNLLTFGNVSGEVFDRTQALALALDLSQKLGQDLQTSAVMLGKALNDPILGLTALRRVGIQLTDSQEEQVKAMVEVGDVASAQAVILAELEKQFGNVAEEAAKTDSGKITQAMMAIGDAMESVGAVILPVVADIAQSLKRVAEAFQALSPATQKFVVVAGLVAAAIGPILIGLGLAASGIGVLAGAFALISAPVALVVAGIAAVAAGAFVVIKNWDGISAWFRDKWEAVKRVTAAAWEGLKSLFFRFHPAGILFVHWDSVTAWFRDKWDAVKAATATAWAGIGATFSAAYTKLTSIWGGLVGWFGSVLDKIGALFDALWNRIFNRTQKAAGDFKSQMAFMAQVAPNPVGVAPGAAGVGTAGAALMDGLEGGITGNAAGPVGATEQVADDIVNAFKAKTETQSPSRLFQRLGGMLMQGLGLGIGQGAALPVQQMDDAVGALETSADAAATAADTANSGFQRMGRTLADLLTGATSLRQVLADLILGPAQTGTSQGLSSLGDAIGGRGGGLVAGLLGGLMGFASGGSFAVGGTGGIDSQLVAFRASPNETVHINTPQQEAALRSGESGADRGPVINNFNITTPDVEGFRKSRVQIASDMSRALQMQGRS